MKETLVIILSAGVGIFCLWLVFVIARAMMRAVVSVVSWVVGLVTG